METGLTLALQYSILNWIELELNTFHLKTCKDAAASTVMKHKQLLCAVCVCNKVLP